MGKNGSGKSTFAKFHAHQQGLQFCIRKTSIFPDKFVNTSVNRKPKHPSATPSSVNKSASCSKSFSACQKTFQSSTLSTPFLLRTELRAEKRKQERSEAEVWKLRQSLCFRARPLPEFYRERKAQEMQSQSPKAEGKSRASITETKNPLTRFAAKSGAKAEPHRSYLIM